MLWLGHDATPRQPAAPSGEWCGRAERTRPDLRPPEPLGKEPPGPAAARDAAGQDDWPSDQRRGSCRPRHRLGDLTAPPKPSVLRMARWRRRRRTEVISVWIIVPRPAGRPGGPPPRLASQAGWGAEGLSCCGVDPKMCLPAPALNLASRRAAGERPRGGAWGGRSRLCGQVLWRRLSGWMRYRPAAVVVDSGGVIAGSADLSPCLQPVSSCSAEGMGACFARLPRCP